jgi:hypothetical protein
LSRRNGACGRAYSHRIPVGRLRHSSEKKLFGLLGVLSLKALKKNVSTQRSQRKPTEYAEKKAHGRASSTGPHSGMSVQTGASAASQK